MASESLADARDTPRTPGPGARSRLGRNSKNLSRSNLSAEPVRRAQAGGAGRDRTGDLKLAKLPLSQLSYGPKIWWAPKVWWAWEDLNFRPHAYQARALTN